MGQPNSLTAKHLSALRKIFLHYSTKSLGQNKTFEFADPTFRTMYFSQFKRLVDSFEIVSKQLNLFGLFRKEATDRTIRFEQFVNLLLYLSKFECREQKFSLTSQQYLIQRFKLDQRFGWYEKANLEIPILLDKKSKAQSMSRSEVNPLVYEPLISRLQSKLKRHEAGSGTKVNPSLFLSASEKTLSDFYISKIMSDQKLERRRPGVPLLYKAE